MTSVPRWTESILRGLGADAGFGEDLLGDLTEEFTSRAATGGVAAARRWYYRESLRAIPHLVMDWRHHASPRDVRALAGVVLASLMLVVTTSVALRLTVHGLVVLGVVPGAQLAPAAAWSMVGLLLAFTTALLGGYVAARMYSRAPVVAAAALGAIWSGFTIVGLLLAPDLPLGARAFAIPLALMVATVGGGFVRACSSPRVRSP
jgi:hypothetical protein